MAWVDDRGSDMVLAATYRLCPLRRARACGRRGEPVQRPERRVPPRQNCCAAVHGKKKVFEIDKSYPLFLTQEMTV